MNENKTNINWLITINLNPFGTSCNIKENQKIDLTCFVQKYVKIDKNWSKMTVFNTKQ